MGKYRFSAKTASGDLIKEVLEAESESSFLSVIRDRQLFLIDFKRIDRSAGFLSADLQISKLSLKNLAVFCRQISTMLLSGVSLVKAIDILYQQSFDKKMKQSLQKLYESVQKGDMLSEGLKKQTGVYPEIMLSMIESGEASGTLDKVMHKLAAQFESDLKLRNKLISAVTYPAILMVLCVAIVGVLFLAVLPTFMGLFAGLGEENIPGLTKMMMNISNWASSNWYILLFVVIALPLGLRAYFKTDAGRLQWDEFKLRAPLLGMLTSRVSAVRFSRTLATLFASGMALLPALEIIGRVVNNKVVEDAITGVREDIRKGANLSQAVSRVAAFPPMLHSMIAVGEESGTLDSVLESTANYFDDEVENASQRLITFVEPILLIIMGAVVATVILSVMLPMMAMYEAI